jgi:heme oxygenase
LNIAYPNYAINIFCFDDFPKQTNMKWHYRTPHAHAPCG